MDSLHNSSTSRTLACRRARIPAHPLWSGQDATHARHHKPGTAEASVLAFMVSLFDACFHHRPTFARVPAFLTRDRRIRKHQQQQQHQQNTRSAVRTPHNSSYAYKSSSIAQFNSICSTPILTNPHTSGPTSRRRHTFPAFIHLDSLDSNCGGLSSPDLRMCES